MNNFKQPGNHIVTKEKPFDLCTDKEKEMLAKSFSEQMNSKLSKANQGNERGAMGLLNLLNPDVIYYQDQGVEKFKIEFDIDQLLKMKSFFGA
ncbi:MAG: hypothetical protein AAFQ94_09285 [Bacteroidota bacterium]